MSLLTLLLLTPLFGAFVILFIPYWKTAVIKKIALCFSLVCFVLSLLLWLLFDNSSTRFQFLSVSLDHFDSYSFLISRLYKAESESALHFVIGLDGISLFFVLLTTFLIPVCLLVAWQSVTVSVKEYALAFLIIETLMICVFSVLDLLLFYVFFESVLIPMFLIIGIWGSRERKIRAAYQFFLFTLFGSLFMLLALLLIYFQAGSTDIELLYSVSFSQSREYLLWLAFFASFAVKVPMLPVHIWLPEAHVEAPTAGSVLLAGIMLKLGTYAFLRFSIPLFPSASIQLAPIVLVLSLLAIVYISLLTCRQTDLKKIIAYSSVAHMNFVTLGLFSLNAQGVEGSVLLMLSHGIVSPALFLLVGALYERHKTRLVNYYSGSAIAMPVFASMFLIFTMANISLPGTSSFVGEFLVLSGALLNNSFAALIAASGMVLGAVYALFLLNRIVYGFCKTDYIAAVSDLSRRELFMFLPFLFIMFFIGIYAEPFLDVLRCSVGNLLEVGII